MKREKRVVRASTTMKRNEEKKRGRVAGRHGKREEGRKKQHLNLGLLFSTNRKQYRIYMTASVIQNIIEIKRNRMQVCNNYSPSFTAQHTQLHKTASLPSFQLADQQYYSSSSSIESIEEGYWRGAAKWIMRLRRKINVSKSTLYLAISYLWKLIKLGFVLNEDNYQKIAATLVLLSAKMNEIYPPKMSSLINRCSQRFTKDDMTHTENVILSFFNFDMSFSEISLSYLTQILGQTSQDKCEDAQKLLGLAVTEREIMKLGEEFIALGIVYLIKPSLVREYGCQNLQKVKAAASKIYSLYIANKSGRS